MTLPLISVIIPVYNVEKYLSQCLDSILCQSYKNLEIICINDGSTDASLFILKKFQQKDHRVILLNQENKGPGVARNKGLKQAKGKYVYFIDPDDLFPNKNVLLSLYKKITRKKGVMCGGSSIILAKNPIIHANFQQKITFSKNGWIKSRDFPNPYGFWRFLYQRDFLLKNDIFFPDYRHYEDPPFFLKALIKAEKFYAVKDVVHIYRKTDKKICWDFVKVQGLIKGIRDCLELTSKNNFYKMHFTIANSFKNQFYLNALSHLVNKRDYRKLLEDAINTINYQIIFKIQDNFILPNLLKNVQNKISIIIPVYNVEKYLSQCLNSIINQTYQNLEIICVNDGSTDNSLSILKEFQQKDSRIIILNQKNKGISAARNTGLERATSAYVSFIDSDDYVDPRYIEILYNKLCEENADFSLCNIWTFGKNIKTNLMYEHWIKRDLKQNSSFIIDPNKILPMAWGKLFRMDIIKKHQIQFPEGLINEDNYWHFLYCMFSKKYTIAYEKLYFHRKDNPHSIMAETRYQLDHYYDVFKISCRLFDKVLNTGYFNVYHTFLDDFFFRQLKYVIGTHKKVLIDSVFWDEIKEYLVRSKSAQDKFKQNRAFNMLTTETWYNKNLKNIYPQKESAITSFFLSDIPQKEKFFPSELLLNIQKEVLGHDIVIQNQTNYASKVFESHSYKGNSKKFDKKLLISLLKDRQYVNFLSKDLILVDKPKVSIIIPVYNAEKYLHQCLDSVVHQTLKEIEIICIEDESTDNSLQILKEYAQNDWRISIIKQKNAGVSAARNKGIKLARGKYIGFIDSDDWIDSDFYEKLFFSAEKNNTDITKTDMLREFLNSSEKSSLNKIIKNNQYDFLGEFYSAIYRRDFLISKNVFFPENILTGEDITFSLKAVLGTQNIQIIENTNYHYRIRPLSKSKSLSEKMGVSLIENIILIINILNNNSEKIGIDTYIRIVKKFTYQQVLRRCKLANKSYSETINLLKNLKEKMIPLLKYYIKGISDPNLKEIYCEYFGVDYETLKSISYPKRSVSDSQIENIETFFDKKVLFSWVDMKNVRFLFSKLAHVECYENRTQKPDFIFIWGNGLWSPQHETIDYAAENDIPLIKVEDGFLYGADTWCNNMVDKKYTTGISFTFTNDYFHFDATHSSYMERQINDPEFNLTEEQYLRTQKVIKKIVENHLTKYNHQPIFQPKIGREGSAKVLVVDQSYEDFSISLGLASDITFKEMLETAIRENPNADIIIKTHPDAIAPGTKRPLGYYSNFKEYGNIHILREPINPISLLKYVDKVYVCTTQLGFEALLCGKEVHTFGMPFYAGWGLTIDKLKNPRRTRKRTLEELFYITYIKNTRYIDPVAQKICSIERAVEYLIELREEYQEYKKLKG